MGKKLPPKEMRLYQRIDEVLHYIWDPIGVAGAAGARDEYHSYLPTIFRMVSENATPSKIADHLVEIERNRMGLKPNAKRALKAAETMIEHRKWLDETLPN